MNEIIYNEVPNIITGKDLDYLSDMFNWNLGCYKKTQNCKEQVEDEQIKEMIEKCSNTFLNHSNQILNILERNQNE